METEEKELMQSRLESDTDYMTHRSGFLFLFPTLQKGSIFFLSSSRLSIIFLKMFVFCLNNEKSNPNRSDFHKNRKSQITHEVMSKKMSDF